MTIAQLAEAGKLSAASLTGKTWKIKIIEGDRQGSSAYYPKEALEKGKHLFKKGTRIYLNHPSSEAKWSQPERRAEDIIGYLSEDAEFDGKDLYGNAEFFEEHQSFIKSRAEADVIAMSIRAEGTMVETSKGLELAEFTAVHSVDVVTVGGAGGGFEKLLESARNENNSAAERLAEAQKEETKLEISQEFIDLLEKQSKLTTDLLEKLDAKEVAEAAAAKAELDEAERVKNEAPAGPTAAAIAAALLEAKLSEKAQARVLAAVEAGTDLTEAVKTEVEIAEEYLTEARKNNGGGHIVEDGANLSEAEQLDKAFSSIYG